MDKKTSESLILCTICARGGSKAVPNKNTREIAGKPLIAHTIIQAVSSGLFKHVAVSSDSSEILEIAGRFGADILVRRPDELAQDVSGKIPAIIHCAKAAEAQSNCEFDIFVDLDATSPLRLTKDIAGAIDLLKSKGCANVITGTTARRSPYFNLVERQERGHVALAKSPEKQILRRQDAPTCYDMNASIYVWTKTAFWAGAKVFDDDTQIFEMPDERSIDIDSPLDWDIVEFLMSREND